MGEGREPALNMSQAAGQLDALTQQQAGLKAAIDSGSLALEPGVAEKAAKICRDQIGELEQLKFDVEQLGTRLPFGDCEVGNQLSAKFALKAKGGPNSIYDVLVQSQQVLENMARNYEAAGRMYHQVEQDSAAAFKGIAH